MIWGIVDHIAKVKHLQRMQGQDPYLHTASICPPFNSGFEQNPGSLRTHYGVKVIVFLNVHNRIRHLRYSVFQQIFGTHLQNCKYSSNDSFLHYTTDSKSLITFRL